MRKIPGKDLFLSKSQLFFFLKENFYELHLKQGFLCFSEHLYMPGLDNCPPDADRAWLDVQNLWGAPNFPDTHILLCDKDKKLDL